MVLNQDFREFIESLNAESAQYLVVGGYAVALHGYPRYTKDIDIWIQRDLENARRIVAALERFGFGSLGLTCEDFLVPDQIVQLGLPPSRIDLITGLPGVEFEACYATRMIVEVDDLPVNFIDLTNLRLTKRASGRLQDLADLENLED